MHFDKSVLGIQMHRSMYRCWQYSLSLADKLYIRVHYIRMRVWGGTHNQKWSIAPLCKPNGKHSVACGARLWKGCRRCAHSLRGARFNAPRPQSTIHYLLILADDVDGTMCYVVLLQWYSTSAAHSHAARANISYSEAARSSEYVRFRRWWCDAPTERMLRVLGATSWWIRDY